MPSMTFAASANAVRYTGAEAVFVDSRPEGGNLDVELFLEALDILVDEGADIAAVMSVDPSGGASTTQHCCPVSRAEGSR